MCFKDFWFSLSKEGFVFTWTRVLAMVVSRIYNLPLSPPKLYVWSVPCSEHLPGAGIQLGTGGVLSYARAWGADVGDRGATRVAGLHRAFQRQQ